MPSFGELLRRERELRKISLREVSEATKINLRYLEAMERNDFRHLPGGVFNKGFVRAFAQYIGVDPEGMINAYLLEERKQEDREAAAGEDGVLRGRGPAGGRTEPPPAPKTRRFPWLVAILALAAVGIVILVVWFVLARRSDEKAAPVEPARSGTASRDDSGPASLPPPPEREVDRTSSAPSSSAEADAQTAPEEAPEPTPSRTPDAPRAGAEDRSPSTSGAPDVRRVAVTLARPTSGRIVCDRRVEILDGRPAGTEWSLRCALLVVEAQDGGAVRVGVDGAAPDTIGQDGEPTSRDDLLVAGRN